MNRWRVVSSSRCDGRWQETSPEIKSKIQLRWEDDRAKIEKQERRRFKQRVNGGGRGRDGGGKGRRRRRKKRRRRKMDGTEVESGEETFGKLVFGGKLAGGREETCDSLNRDRNVSIYIRNVNL